MAEPQNTNGGGPSIEFVDIQEEQFARAFEVGDVSRARELYHPQVAYISPTTRLFGRPPRIEGREATLDFIQETIAACRNITYRVDERAVVPGGAAAYVRVLFDWDTTDARVRSTYVVVYRYRGGKISMQELYYDPSGPFERLGPPLDE
jgi:ketosteroid isomerase-like protein